MKIKIPALVSFKGSVCILQYELMSGGYSGTWVTGKDIGKTAIIKKKDKIDKILSVEDWINANK